MITNHQRDIIQRMKSGTRLCVENTPDGKRYFFSDGSADPQAGAVKALRGMAVIAPADDGMFGEHQSYDLMFDPSE